MAGGGFSPAAVVLACARHRGGTACRRGLAATAVCAGASGRDTCASDPTGVAGLPDN